MWSSFSIIKQRDRPKSLLGRPHALQENRLYPLLFDTGFFTGQRTQIVEFGATYFTTTVNYNLLDERRFDGEDSLHTHVARHLANRETLFVTVTRDADNVAAELLDTLLVSLFDTVRYGNRVTTAKLGVLFTACECFFCNLY